MAKIYYQEMTPAGYRAIEEQIEALKQKRPTLITRLKAARALGDLSENTEYSTAKRELRHLESRLRYLDKQLTYAKVIDVSDDGKVGLGKVVTIRFLDDQEEATYQIVGRHQAEQASLTRSITRDRRAISKTVSFGISTSLAPFNKEPNISNINASNT